MLGLAISLGSLAAIGRPPAVRIDALWVSEHQGVVELCLSGTGMALVGALLALLARRQRVAVALLWIFAIVAAASMFSDRTTIIARVLIEHAF